jgi:hypothetical protein
MTALPVPMIADDAQYLNRSSTEALPRDTMYLHMYRYRYRYRYRHANKYLLNMECSMLRLRFIGFTDYFAYVCSRSRTTHKVVLSTLATYVLSTKINSILSVLLIEPHRDEELTAS